MFVLSLHSSIYVSITTKEKKVVIDKEHQEQGDICD